MQPVIDYEWQSPQVGEVALHALVTCDDKK